MKRSPKLVLYGAFAAVCFLLALVLGRPELTALGAPFALVLVIGLSLPRPSLVQASMSAGRERVVEGEEIEAEVVLRAPLKVPQLHLALSLPHGVRLAEGQDRFLLGLKPGEERRLPLRLVCERWGVYRLGGLTWRSSDAAGLRFMDGHNAGDRVLRVYPRAERLRAMVIPLETQPFAGNRVARAKGEGIEFADVRPYLTGDRPRRVNWRATTLHQRLYVNQQYPERNSDIVIFLDNFAEAKREDESTLDLTVRAAAALIDYYLSARDRVGLVSFGGLVRWLTPGAGDIQRYRIVEALLETEVELSFVWRNIDVVPRRCLTPQALVVALTPLLDERSLGALLNLRRRGFDLVVIEISPLTFAESSSRSLDVLATRFWRLWRDSMLFRLEELGVAVVEWDGRAPLAERLEEVRAFRRFARYASR